MASNVRRVALKSLLLGVFLLACEFAWTYSKRYHLSRQSAQFNGGRLLEIPDTLNFKERREQFLAAKFGRSGTGNYAVSQRMNSPNGTKVIQGRSSVNKEDILPQRVSNTRKNILFREHNKVHINLDSGAWNASDKSLASTMEEMKHLLSRSELQVNVACSNPVRHVTFERPITRLSHGKYVVGHVDQEVSKYAVLSVGVDLRDKQTDSYAFYAPLTSLAWKRLDYGVITIIADTIHDWLELPVTRHVMSYLCQTGAVMFFLPTSKEKVPLIGQASKLFIAPLLNEYYHAVGSGAVPENAAKLNPFLLLADVDSWVLQRHEFSAESKIVSLNNGCCQWFNHKGWRLKSWPLAYLGMRVSTWWELLAGSTAIFRKMQMTSYGMVGVFRRRFGDLVKEPMVRGQDGAWHLPEYMLGLWLNGYIMTKGAEHVLFADRPAPRLEPKTLSVSGSVPDFDAYFDVHLPKMARVSYKNDAWSQISPLLEYMYGAGSVELRWCTEYHKEYMTYIKAYRTSEDAPSGVGLANAKRDQTPQTGQARAVAKTADEDRVAQKRGSSATQYEFRDQKYYNAWPNAQKPENPKQNRKQQRQRLIGGPPGFYQQQRFMRQQLASPRKPMKGTRAKPNVGPMRYGYQQLRRRRRRSVDAGLARKRPTGFRRYRRSLLFGKRAARKG